MDLLLDSMNDVARECGVAVPSIWAANNDDTYVQLKMYLRQTANELLQRIDWHDCTLDFVVTGSGTDTYALPDDYHRLTRDYNAVYGNSPQRWGFGPITSNGGWTALKSFGATSTYLYRLIGTSIQFSQVINGPAQITIAYVTKAWMDKSGVRASEWTDDAQTTYLPSRLLELGTIWRWKKKMEVESSSYKGEYETELTRYSNDDRQLQTIDFSKDMEALAAHLYGGR